MAMPFIFDKGSAGSGPDRARRSVKAMLGIAVEFAIFAAIALAVLIAVAAIRIVTFLH